MILFDGVLECWIISQSRRGGRADGPPRTSEAVVLIRMRSEIEGAADRRQSGCRAFSQLASRGRVRCALDSYPPSASPRCQGSIRIINHHHRWAGRWGPYIQIKEGAERAGSARRKLETNLNWMTALTSISNNVHPRIHVVKRRGREARATQFYTIHAPQRSIERGEN